MSNQIRILIVGCGYVGTELAKLLRDNGHAVYTLSRSAKYINGCNHISADLMNLVPEMLPDVQYIFFLAAPDHHSKTAYENIYMHGLEKLINAYKDRPVKRLIFASSSVVYAENSGQWIDETATTHRDEFRADTMLQAEEIALSFSQSPMIARISAIYGPGRHPLLDQVLRQERFLKHDTVYSNRIYITDLCRALEHLMRIEYNETIYNITDQEPTPINTILSWLATITGTLFPEAALSDQNDHRNLKNRRISCERIIRAGFSHMHPSFQQGFHAIFKLQKQQKPLDY